MKTTNLLEMFPYVFERNIYIYIYIRERERRERERERERESWLVSFTVRVSFLGYFISKSAKALWSPIIYDTKTYLPNHLKKINIISNRSI